MPPPGPTDRGLAGLGLGPTPRLRDRASDAERAYERKLRRAEAHVAWMRNAVAAFVWLTVPWLLGRPGLLPAAFLALAVAATIHTALAYLGYRGDWGDVETRTLVTSLGDAAAVLGVLAVSGGWASPLTPLLYVSMAAVAYRHELADGLAFGLGYGLAYAGVLFAIGDLGVDPVALILRVGLLVATGLLASLSARSFLEAEIERSRTRHAVEDILETVPGEVALVPRSRAFEDGSEDESLPRREVVAEALADWMPEEGIERAQEALGRVFASGETVEFEVSVADGGPRRTYRSLAGPLGEDDEIGAAVVVSTDVTDRKRAQRRIQDHARALEQSNRALARYASMTAHDLREPLRDIVRYLQRLERRETDLRPESREELGFVVERAHRLDHLVRALHGFAEVDERPFQVEPVDLASALEDALGLADLSGGPRLEVNTGDLGSIQSDRRAIVGVLAHLIENAHQHAGRDVVHVWVDARETEEGWRIVVEDDGRGIDPRYHDRIFEPFRRLDAEPSPESTGMGLATVRRLVERLGGEITLDSEPGAGARFTFTVPRRPVTGEAEGLEELFEPA